MEIFNTEVPIARVVSSVKNLSEYLLTKDHTEKVELRCFQLQNT